MDYVTVDYSAEMGKNPLTDEMRSVLSGLTVEEQLDYFVLEECKEVSESDYGDADEYTQERNDPLKTQMEYSDFDVKVEKLIVSDGIIVGVFFYRRSESVLLNQWYCTYSDSEEDGPWKCWVSVSKRVVFVNKTN